MEADSDSDGHPIDDYLARAAKRPRVGSAAEQDAADGHDESGGAGLQGGAQIREVPDEKAPDDEFTDDGCDDGVGNSHDGSVTSNDAAAADGPGDVDEGEEVTGEEAEIPEDGEALGGNDGAATGAGTGRGDLAIDGLAEAGSAAEATAAAATAPDAALQTLGKLVGVVLVDDTAEIVRDNGLTKLLRNPRYFDDYAEVQTHRCFNCGQIGHPARDCTNQARVKPCHLCAQFGHDGRYCPNRLCYRCGQTGHKVRDCRGSGGVEGRPCLRCGRGDCDAAGKGDYFRYEGGCNKAYTPADLRHVRCMCCGDFGHLMCKPAPKSSLPSCYNCGRMGHYGEGCPSGTRPHLAAERRGDEERAATELLEYEMQLDREYDEKRRREQSQRGYGGAPGGGVGYDRRRDGGGGGGIATGFYVPDQWQYGGGGGGRYAQMDWPAYEPRWDDRRGGGDGGSRGQRRSSPEPYPRGGRAGAMDHYEERRTKTPRW
ncbi:hypothetical protein Vafri_9938 [Volvox africanus]|uniref:CCHC-type domain-containing protein n=1 Tax=Volvox africanus TaxID=51714 RepID=A0A8J4B5A6_9CHLO|nr:hypothetical protein Vafri_9938 [Volvox africanus]